MDALVAEQTPGTPASYGGFALGSMQLALPMSALREVLPRGDLRPLPCKAPGVLGGVDLRGVVVPVLDLRVLLGVDAPASEHPTVVMMVHGGRMLGLLADRVTGIFTPGTDSLHETVISNAAAPVYAGSLRRPDNGTLVSVLSPLALASLPDVPMMLDPEPQRLLASGEDVLAVAADADIPVMLVRCGAVTLALEAMAVQTTVAHPEVDRSLPVMGLCSGFMHHGGSRMPVVDLLALCRMGSQQADQAAQAFIVRVGDGQVALLVQEVIDVVRIARKQLVKLPAFALAAPGLFAGALPASVIATDAGRPQRQSHGHYLMLDSAALCSFPELVELSALATGRSMASAEAGQGDATAAETRSMIIFDLFDETAAPLDQVAEILPYPPEGVVINPQACTLGLVVNRGRSIPLICLRTLLGLAPVEFTGESSVLVVQSDHDWLGFTVSRLRTIEPALWEPILPVLAQGEPTTLDGLLPSRRLSLVGQGDQERMLRVLDLQGIARALRARHAVAPTA